MKKTLFLITSVLFFIHSHSQDGTDKKIQAGISIESGMIFQQLRTSLIKKNGVGYSFQVGVDLNYNFTKNIGFFTGLSFGLEGFGYNFNLNNNRYFYNYLDKDVLTKETVGEFKSYDSLLILNRSYRPVLMTIPTMILFKTNQIGYLKYFGKFGLRTSFILAQFSNDRGYENGNTKKLIDLENMNLKRDLLWIKASAGIAGGVEWNFNGSASLVGEIGFYYGFTNVHSQSSFGSDSKANLAIYENTGGSSNYFAIRSNQMQLLFKVGVLF